MERDKVAKVLLDFMEWNKAEFRTENKLTRDVPKERFT
jgi:hypothetical protein